MMSALEVWLTLIGLTAATLITRVGFLLFDERVRIPPRIERALRYAPACALAAIVVPDLVFTRGTLALTVENARLMAGLASTAFFLVTRSMIGTIVFGMVLFTALRLFG